MSAIHAISADALRCWDGMCPGLAWLSGQNGCNGDSRYHCHMRSCICKVSHATPERQLTATSVQQVWHHFLFDRIFTNTIVLCDENRIVSSMLGMAWIQIAIMLDGNFEDFNVAPNDTVRLGVTGMAKCWL